MSEVAIRANDREISTESGNSLLRAIMDAGIPIDTACGGQARCHLCRVTITEGRDGLNEANPIEYKALGNVLIAQGMRLACQVRVTQPLTVSVPEPRPKRRRGPPPRPSKPSGERRQSRPERPSPKPVEAREHDADKQPRDEKARETVSSEEPHKKKRRRRRRPRRRPNNTEGS